MRERFNILNLGKEEPSPQEAGPRKQTLGERMSQRWGGSAPQQEKTSRYLDILHFDNDPAPERTAKAAEALGKTTTKKAPFALGAILGWVLLKGAVELPIKTMNWILKETPEWKIPGIPALGIDPLSLELIDRKLYLKTFQKWAGKYGRSDKKEN